MSIKSYKPTSPGRRSLKLVSDANISKKKPEKSLVKGKKRISGRDSTGRVSVRFRGGGHKRQYREMDLKREKTGIVAIVKAIEYDPNRSSNIALLQYLDGVKSYILAPNKLSVGDRVISGTSEDIKIGNHMVLKNIPLGTQVHNIEMKPGKGGQLVRSAGASAQLVAKEGKMAQLRLPSGESRYIPLECRATIGQVGNTAHELVKIGKAGRNRWLGRMPHNRGVVMNPVDHPHGGGEGKTSGGRHPVTPWGKPTKGHKTRKNKRSDSMIVKRRKSTK